MKDNFKGPPGKKLKCFVNRTGGGKTEKTPGKGQLPDAVPLVCP